LSFPPRRSSDLSPEAQQASTAPPAGREVVMQPLIQSSEWIIPAALLVVVAWSRFNSPPTNRSGTTFVLFSFGLIFYYALIVALWLLVIIAVIQASIGFDKLSFAVGKTNLQAQGEFAQYAPLVAAVLVIVPP